LLIIKNDSLIASNVKIADNFWNRFVGFLGRRNISENEAILFTKSSQMHTFFMLTKIDIIFLDKNKKILKIYHELKPFRWTSLVSESYAGYVLELRAGKAKKLALKEGDILDFRD
jgi:hypothetical protein